MWLLTSLAKLQWLVPLVLRAAVGVSFFLFHGLDKVYPGGEWDFGQKFASKGAAPAVLMYVAAWTEFLGGFALLLGVLTRWAAIGLLGVMVYAIFVVHGSDPYAKRELAIAYAAALSVIAIRGPGQVSLDRLFFGKQAL
ncbi:MAG: DoxX family protein [Planctomycetota bacterium]|nr:DoxX family protein [Planctomycetota bacterium]